MKLARTPVTHQHVAKILYLDGVRTSIDANIAPLIYGLYKLGIKTRNSCGGGCGGYCDLKHKQVGKKIWYGDKTSGKRMCWYHTATPKRCQESVWLTFNPIYATRFLNVCSRSDDASELRDEMCGFGNGIGKKNNAWLWRNIVDDDNLKLGFLMICVFPHAHLDLVTQRVLSRA